MSASHATICAPRYPRDGVTYPTSAEVEALVASGDWVSSTLAEECRRAAQDAPDKVFLVDDRREVTFGELDARSEQVGAGLIRLGLNPGDAAVFQMATNAETVIALLGCMKAGVLPLCTLPQHRAVEIGQLARQAKARAYFVQADVSKAFDLVAFAQAMAGDIPTLGPIVASYAGGTPGCLDLESLGRDIALDDCRRITGAVQPGPCDVALLQLSGGSTGLPKIIPRFHGDYLGAARAWCDRLALDEAEVGLWTLPLIHNAAMVLMLWPLLALRGQLILSNRFEPTEFLTKIQVRRVTYTGSIGPIAARLLDLTDLSAYDLSSLKRFVTLQGAEAIETHLGVTPITVYGITEGLLMASTPQDPADVRLKSIGYPSMAGDAVKILTPGGEDEVAFGDIGELCFRGPTTLQDYFGSSERSAKSFTPSGLFRSGDLVRAHRHDGVLCYSFEGRLVDNINRGGEKIGAEEVEGLVIQHPDVLDAKVVAMPDRHLGERACAFVILRSGCDPLDVDALGRFLTTRGLAKYKFPERIEVVETFPVTNAGKVDKASLRRRIADLIESETAP
jgi:pyochelin biosynthesis protein PchD